MSAPSLVLREAARSWGSRRALEPVSLDIEPGSIVAIAGPSGSGKTTLLRLLMASLRPSAGQVVVDGRSLDGMKRRELREYRRRLGVLHQDWLVVPQLAVHDNVVAGLVAGWPWYQVMASTVWPLERRRVAGLLARLGLGERQWDRAGELSGGQKQRVAVARALVHEPDLICADEPTASLDPATASDVVELVTREARGRGAGLLLCTHRLSQVLGFVDRVLGLRDGAVVLDGPPGVVDDDALRELYEGSRELA